jgi:hypothetical protein
MEPRRKPRGGNQLMPRAASPSAHVFTQSLPRSFVTTLPPRLEELDRATSELPGSYGVQKFLADQQRATYHLISARLAAALLSEVPFIELDYAGKASAPLQLRDCSAMHRASERWSSSAAAR